MEKKKTSSVAIKIKEAIVLISIVCCWQFLTFSSGAGG
jgi:hypothetical protein